MIRRWIATRRRPEIDPKVINSKVITSKGAAINVGCGHEIVPGYWNIDVRSVDGIDFAADVNRLPLASGSVRAARAGSLLEHFDDPCAPLAELHRVLADDGRLIIRVPALGTNAAHLDPTHRFLADLVQWREILSGYFDRVQVDSIGVRYRGSPLLVAIQRVLITTLGFHDLGQCWVFTASGKRQKPERRFKPWWNDSSLMQNRSGYDAADRIR